MGKNLKQCSRLLVDATQPSPNPTTWGDRKGANIAAIHLLSFRYPSIPSLCIYLHSFIQTYNKISFFLPSIATVPGTFDSYLLLLFQGFDSISFIVLFMVFELWNWMITNLYGICLIQVWIFFFLFKKKKKFFLRGSIILEENGYLVYGTFIEEYMDILYDGISFLKSVFF